MTGNRAKCVVASFVTLSLLSLFILHTRWQKRENAGCVHTSLQAKRTTYPVRDNPNRPPPLLLSVWQSIQKRAANASALCPNFLVYSVSVHSSRAEAHHTSSVGRPSVKGAEHCAILFLLLTEKLGDSEALGRRQELEKKNFDLGWIVLSAHHELPANLARRASRLPKIVPSEFFPHTDIVLYSDIKLLVHLQHVEARSVASKLLHGTQFGIVQHGWSEGMKGEQRLILDARRVRPSVVDSIEKLDIQASNLETFLSSSQQHDFAVDGALHAHVLHSGANAKLFDTVWYEEYASGSDRDQMAFYGAAARMDMRKQEVFPCNNLNRSGIYRSSHHHLFSFAIHCNFSDIGIKGYP